MNIQRYQKSLKKTWWRLRNRLLRGRRILVLGDSHSGVFEYCFDMGMLAPHWLNCEIVGGATAYGLNSNSSVTQAWQKFDHSLQRFHDFDVVLIMLGECDCSFSIWKKSERSNIAPESLVDHSIEGIRRLVKKIIDVSADKRKKQIILAGAILPTISDAALLIQSNLLRREISATQLDRTKLVLHFNAKLKLLAEELGVDHIDVTEQMLNAETGLIDCRFLHRIDDHHQSNPATSKIWSASLLELL